MCVHLKNSSYVHFCTRLLLVYISECYNDFIISSQSDGLPFRLNALVYILLLEAVMASFVKFTK